MVKDRVVSRVDLPGVPAGTAGRVILKNGLDRPGSDQFEWIRYRVWFDDGTPNGTDIGSLSRDVLQRVDRKGNPVEGD